MTAQSQPPVRLSGPGDIAAALPNLVGFRPRESLVVVSLHGPKRRLGLTVRVDLPPPVLRRRVVESVVHSLLTDAPSAALVAVVSEDADVRVTPVLAGGAEAAPVPELPHRALVRDAVLGLGRVRLPVADPLLVRAGRWWSYDCADRCCAPDAGTPLPGGTTELAAASVLAGQVLVADRAALAARIAPVGFLAAAGMAAACDEVGQLLAVRSVVEGWEVLVEESCSMLAQAVARAGAERLDDRQVARLAWGLRDTEVRDRALAHAAGRDRAGAEALWTELTRRAPVPLDAAPATLLALTAWVRGDGPMAGVALERALTSEPSYTLARLLQTALDDGLSPHRMREFVQEVTTRAGRLTGPAGWSRR